MPDICSSFGVVMLIAAVIYGGVQWKWFDQLAQYWLKKKEGESGEHQH